jgi:hypothetical protein
MTFELALGVWAVVTLVALVAAVYLLAVLTPRLPWHRAARRSGD